MTAKTEMDVGTDTYGIHAEKLLTPALVLYPELVSHNIRRMVDLCDGDPLRWRPHLKTAKIGAVMKMLVAAGVTRGKCATTLELLTACQSGFQDVLVAYPHTGANAARIIQIANQFPDVRIACMVESQDQIRSWLHTGIGLFIDVNPGMDRTGIDRRRTADIVELARSILSAGLEFRGIHYYDGHAKETNLEERTQAAHRRYDELLTIVSALESSGVAVTEVITSGTPAFPCALMYAGFTSGRFLHQVSPGTIVYNDVSSLAQLPGYGFQPAALVLSRVVSHPRPGIITCDAGHKSVSVDSGIPNCAVLGHPEFVPQSPSEEHLPIGVPLDDGVPPIGSVLYLMPRHVCPTVNNASYALVAGKDGNLSVETVSARGHEVPLRAS